MRYGRLPIAYPVRISSQQKFGAPHTTRTCDLCLGGELRIEVSQNPDRGYAVVPLK
jgi:hypothetical protein